MLLPSARLWRRDEQLPWVSMYCAPGWFASSVPTPAAYCPGVVVAPTRTIHRPSQAGWEIGTARPRSFDCGVFGWGAVVGSPGAGAGTGAGAAVAEVPEPSSVGTVGTPVAAVSVGTVGTPVAAVSVGTVGTPVAGVSVGTGTGKPEPPSSVGTAGAEGSAVTCGPPADDWPPSSVAVFRPRNCPIANAITIRARLAIIQSGTGTGVSARCLGAPVGGGDDHAGRAGGTAAGGGTGPPGAAAASGGSAAGSGTGADGCITVGGSCRVGRGVGDGRNPASRGDGGGTAPVVGRGTGDGRNPASRADGGGTAPVVGGGEAGRL